MLRKLREQWWYAFLWLPLCVVLGLLSGWCCVVFRIISLWTIHYDAAWKWGYFFFGILGLLAFVVLVLFPRRPARNLKAVAASICLVAVALGILFYANTRVISYEVRDVDGGTLADIPIDVTHHANGIALTGFPGETVLRTNKEGKASIRVFKSEECDGRIHDPYGDPPKNGNHKYSDESTFYYSPGTIETGQKWPFGKHEIVEHSYGLEFQNGLPFISQRCLGVPTNSSPVTVQVYLRREDSPTLPPYFDQIVHHESADPDFKTARLLSLGGSIEGFNHLDELLAALSEGDSRQDAALSGLSLLATQIHEIASNLFGFALDGNVPQRRYVSTNDQRQQCSQIIYLWLSGNNSSPPLSHAERVAYIQQRIDQACLKLIDALHPVMLKKKSAFQVLTELQQDGRPALKYYPEVFEKGTPDAQEGALETIGQIAPSAQDIAFLLKSKNPTWIECALRFYSNSTAAELADDLKTLETLKAKETDTQNFAVLERTIHEVSHQLAQDQDSEARLPSSSVEPRYAVIDLGTKMLHPKKITNSGYVLGSGGSSWYVWFNGTITTLQPKHADDIVAADDIDESGTVVGSEASPPGSAHHFVERATWKSGNNPPELIALTQAVSRMDASNAQDQIRALNLPQLANSLVVPLTLNSAMTPLRSQEDDKPPGPLVAATQVIGNGPDGGYLWEVKPTLSASKTFEGPYPINIFLPGEPKVSPWNVTSVASINDGDSIVGTAIYKPSGSDDVIAAGPHGVMLLPLAIVREVIIGGGDCEPIVDNGLDDRAEVPIFGSAPVGTPNASTPETDGQGIFYVQMPGTLASSITLKCGDNRVTVQATPVKGRPNLLRTGKLVLIEHGDPFRAPDITTIDVGSPPPSGNPSLELQMYERTIVR